MNQQEKITQAKASGTPPPTRAAKPAWYKDLIAYETPNPRRAIWQLVNTLVPYALLWIVMVRLVQTGQPYWMTLALAVLAGGFLVRIFIFFHDATHGSFFASRKANTAVGYVCGILTFTAFNDWRHTHAIHHATAGDLDRRGTGDVWTMTREEYEAAPKGRQRAYRLVRNPLVMFGLGPLFMFGLAHRFAHKGASPRDRRSVWITNLALLAILVAIAFTIGLDTFLLIQVPILAIGGAAGMWLFYVQHQFETVYWAQHEDWDALRAAMEGSSYYQLPKVLQWFTSNIGLHHIHHLRARIPNYNLQRCYDEVPAVRTVPPITLGTSLKSLGFNLWDEAQGKMIGFRELRAHP